ncbi:hypothetical protein BDA99DRAFT_561123 [Phascolomyces articulosus]|uniref:Uncharacterized protein n=1 Tax=Phascolomyces articulosus TaxID=60185 RepID=A0AAD5PC69_9FUNG|nr:hypothetical protein BDA99DRAFT_561123 [Phascolomyces articulosus]
MSNFDAVNLSLQAIKNKRVHESGVVGSVCKYNIPLEFTNMYNSGERCRFSVAADKHFGQLKKDGSKVAIRIFHAYGHSMACQIYNNPHYIESFGLVDGEGHKASNRLKKYIQNVKKTATPTLTLYNKICNDFGRPQDCHEYNDVCNLNSDFWNFTTNLISFKFLREYMNKRRAIEERKINEIEIERVKDYAKQQCMSLEAVLKKNDPYGEGWNTLLYRRLQEAEAFYRNVHSARWNRDREVIVPGSGYLEEINNLYGVIDEVEGEVVEEDKDRNEDEEGQKNNEEEVNRLYNEIENQAEGDESDEEQEDEDSMLF